MYGSGKSIENDQNCEVVFIPQEGKKKSESIRKEEILKKLEILEKLEKLEKKYIDNFLNEYNKENKNISIHEFMNETIILSFESKNSNNKRKSNSKK
jgi:predicted RNase H-like nuclease